MSKKFAILREGVKGIKTYVFRLLDKEFVFEAVLECVKQKDLESLIEVVQAHVELVNMENRAKSADGVCTIDKTPLG